MGGTLPETPTNATKPTKATQATKATTSSPWDPATVEVHEGTFRFRHDPLSVAQRALLETSRDPPRDHINGNPLDWALQLDPHLERTLIAVRAPYRFNEPVWFQSDRRLRPESFTSPLSPLPWRPDAKLTRRLLAHVPYVLVLPDEGRVQHAFDLRCVEEPRALAKTLHGRDDVLPATGGYATQQGSIGAIAAQVPYAGARFARSTRKRFSLRIPGGSDDSTVEGVAARILSAHGHLVEAPRLLAALYRLLVGEVVAYWWNDPLRMEARGASTHHPPGANPLEATRRAREAIREIETGDAASTVKQLGETVIKSGHRPPTYRNYVNRLARLADHFGPQGLAGVLEGILRGHNAHSADLIATHRRLPKPLLVEVKSTGDRLRPSQAEAALYHERDGRAGYRIMRIEHTKNPVIG